MKKLMFATALIAAGVAVADVTSANIVGYKDNALRFGQTFLAPCFIDVGQAEDGVDVTNLKPTGAYASGTIIVSELSASGRSIADYQFIKDRKNNWYWAIGSTKINPGEVVLDPGMGVSVMGDAGLGVTASGEVSTKDRTLPLRFGQTFTGNFTAAPLDITKIVPGGNYASGTIIISRLSASGRSIADYQFIKDRKNNWYWAIGSTKIEEGEVIFEPDEGFSVMGDNGLTITIPGPTLN